MPHNLPHILVGNANHDRPAAIQWHHRHRKLMMTDINVERILQLGSAGERVLIPFLFLVLGMCVCCFAPCECLIQGIERRCCGRRVPYPVEGTPIDQTTIKEGVLIKKVISHETCCHHSFPIIERLKDTTRSRDVRRCSGRRLFMSMSDEESQIESSSNENDEDLICRICLEPFQVGDSIAIPKSLPCNHFHFHSACITNWLVRHNNCPICRAVYIEAKPFQGRSNCSLFKHQKPNHLELLESSQFCKEHGLILPISMDAMEK